MLRALVLAAMIGVLSVVGARADEMVARIDVSPYLGRQTLKANKVVVVKSERRLVLLRDGVVVRTYRIALGRNPVGHKLRQGDGRTPEGEYSLDWRNPNSRFHRSIHVSYPNAKDSARAHTRGVAPGGMIMIHGQPNDRSSFLVSKRGDWTEGCIAVTNRAMDEIWTAVKDGTPIEIRP